MAGRQSQHPSQKWPKDSKFQLKILSVDILAVILVGQLFEIDRLMSSDSLTDLQLARLIVLALHAATSKRRRPEEYRDLILYQHSLLVVWLLLLSFILWYRSGSTRMPGCYLLRPLHASWRVYWGLCEQHYDHEMVRMHHLFIPGGD
jgi:hypothetical protein